MSRLELPIQHRTLWQTGDILFRTDLDLLLKDQAGNWRPERFRVDTGTEITTMSAYRAGGLGLSLPAAASSSVVHRQTGLEVRSGYLCLRLVGLDPAEFILACFFLGNPILPPDPKQPVSFPRKLLQPYQLLGSLRFTLDRNASVAAPYGTLTVEHKVP